MTSRVLVVYNPVSGRGGGERFARELATRLEEHGRDVGLLATRADRDVFADVDVTGLEAVVVVGGDGSLNAAVGGLSALEVPIGFGGVGTVNVITLEVGLREDPRAVAELVVGARTARVPLLAANGHPWILFAECGFLGTIVRRANRWRERSGRHGKLEFVVSALRTLPLAWGRPLACRMTDVDGRDHGSRRFSNVLATRARCYGGNMPIPMDGVDLGAERFQVVGFRSRTPVGHLLLLAVAGMRLLPLLRRPLEALGLVEVRSCIELDVDGPAVVGVHVDAESELRGSTLSLPLHVGRSERSFELLVP